MSESSDFVVRFGTEGLDQSLEAVESYGGKLTQILNDIFADADPAAAAGYRQSILSTLEDLASQSGQVGRQVVENFQRAFAEAGQGNRGLLDQLLGDGSAGQQQTQALRQQLASVADALIDKAAEFGPATARSFSAELPRLLGLFGELTAAQQRGQIESLRAVQRESANVPASAVGERSFQPSRTIPSAARTISESATTSLENSASQQALRQLATIVDEATGRNGRLTTQQTTTLRSAALNDPSSELAALPENARPIRSGSTGFAVRDEFGNVTALGGSGDAGTRQARAENAFSAQDQAAEQARLAAERSVTEASEAASRALTELARESAGEESRPRTFFRGERPSAANAQTATNSSPQGRFFTEDLEQAQEYATVFGRVLSVVVSGLEAADGELSAARIGATAGGGQAALFPAEIANRAEQISTGPGFFQQRAPSDSTLTTDASQQREGDELLASLEASNEAARERLGFLQQSATAENKVREAVARGAAIQDQINQYEQLRADSSARFTSNGRNIIQGDDAFKVGFDRTSGRQTATQEDDPAKAAQIIRQDIAAQQRALDADIRAGAAAQKRADAAEDQADQESRSLGDRFSEGFFGAGGSKRRGGGGAAGGAFNLGGLAETAGIVAKYQEEAQVINLVTRAASDAFRQFVDLNQATQELNEQLSDSGGASNAFVQNLQNIATAQGQAAATAVQNAREGIAVTGAQGSDATTVGSTFASQAAQNATLSGPGTDPVQAGQQLAAISAAYGDLTGNVEGFNNAAAVAKEQFGGNIADITAGVSQLAESGKAAGFSLSELTQVVGLVSSRTGQSGNTVAGGLDRVFDLFSGQAGQSNLRTLGIDSSADASVKDRITQLAAVYPSLSAAQQQQTAAALGGAKALQDLLPLLQDNTQLQAAFGKALTDSGAAQRQQESQLDSIRGQFVQLGQALKDIGVDVLNSGLLVPLGAVLVIVKDVVQQVDRLLGLFDALPSSVKDTLSVLAEVVAVVGLIRVGIQRTNLSAAGEAASGGTGFIRRAATADVGSGLRSGFNTSRDAIRNPRNTINGLINRPNAPSITVQQLGNAVNVTRNGETNAFGELNQREQAQALLALAALREEAERAFNDAVSASTPLIQSSLREVSDAIATGGPEVGSAVDGLRNAIGQGDVAVNGAIAQLQRTLEAETPEIGFAFAQLIGEIRLGGPAIGEAFAQVATEARAIGATGSTDSVLTSRGTANDRLIAADDALTAATERVAAAMNGGAEEITAANAARTEAATTQAAASDAAAAENAANAGRNLRGGFTAGAGALGTIGAITVLQGVQSSVSSQIGFGGSGGTEAANESAREAASGAISSGDTQQLTDAITSLNQAAQQEQQASSGFFGSIASGLTGSGNDARLTKSEATTDKATLDAITADRANSALGGTDDASSVFNFAVTGGVQAGLTTLQNSGRDAASQLSALIDAIDNLGSSSSGAGRRLSTGQTNEFEDAGAGAFTNEFNEDKQNLASAGAGATIFHFGGDKADRTASDQLKGVSQDQINSFSDVLGDSLQATLDANGGSINNKDIGKLQASAKSYVEKTFPNLSAAAQDVLINAADQYFNTGASEVGGVGNQSAAPANPQELAAAAAAAAQLAGARGQAAAASASLNGSSDTAALVGANDTVAGLQQALTALQNTDQGKAHPELLEQLKDDITTAQGAAATASIQQLQLTQAVTEAAIPSDQVITAIDAQISDLKAVDDKTHDQATKLQDAAKLAQLAQQATLQTIQETDASIKAGFQLGSSSAGGTRQDSVTDPRNVVGTDQASIASDQDAIQKLQAAHQDIDKATGAPTQQYLTAVQALATDRQKYAQDQVDLANAQEAAGNIPGDKLQAAQTAVDDATRALGIALPGNAAYANAETQYQAAVAALAIVQRDQAVEFAAAITDPRNSVADATVALQSAINKLSEDDGQDYLVKLKAVHDAERALAQAQLDTANAAASAAVAPGDSLGAAIEQLNAATRTLKTVPVGSQAYYTALGQQIQAQLDVAQQTATQAAAITAAGVDPRNTVGTANAAVGTSQAALTGTQGQVGILQGDDSASEKRLAADRAKAARDKSDKSKAGLAQEAQDQAAINAELAFEGQAQQSITDLQATEATEQADINAKKIAAARAAVDLANAQADAAVNQNDAVAVAANKVADLQRILASGTDTDIQAAQDQAALAQAETALAAAQLALANAQLEASVAPGDASAEAAAKVQEARNALTAAQANQDPQAIAQAQAQLDQALYDQAQAAVALTNAINAAGINPRSTLSIANEAVSAAQNVLDATTAGTTAYFTAFGEFLKAVDAQAQAVLAAATVTEQLGTDLTSPVAQAKVKVDEAYRQLQSDLAAGVDQSGINADRLALENAQNAEQSALFTQNNTAAKNAFDLQKISGSQYLSYLNSELTYLQSIKDPNQQIVDEISTIQEDIKGANEQLQGQFNIGDIIIPTVYDVRRAVSAQLAGVGADASGGVSQTNIYVNGADTNAVLSLLQGQLGSSALASTAPVTGRKVGG